MSKHAFHGSNYKDRIFPDGPPEVPAPKHSAYDVIVIGAGHAGCEAAFAASGMGCSTLLVTMDLQGIASMPCNPAVGGIAKGHLVKEIDALGGQMGKVADLTALQMKLLNTRRGPAVWSSRVQSDRFAYVREMTRRILEQPNLELHQDMVSDLEIVDGVAKSVICKGGARFGAKAVILTTGTFLGGKLYVGEEVIAGGRMGSGAAYGLSETLAKAGFRVARLKTGTPPRLDRKTIDFEGLEIMPGDSQAFPFSYEHDRYLGKHIDCHMTYTNDATHELLRDNILLSPLYGGKIEGVGPRYCPSVEDKIVRFADKERHQVFLEPVSLDCDEIYPNGISTCMPKEIQEQMVHSIAGLEKAEILRYGYAVEYDFFPPTQLKPSLETKFVEGLYNAGQVNGTSGYEEAAAQGLVAGINAALKLRGEAPVIFDRSEAYIGVLIDDLVTLGTEEPYRMFTSRAEYRLLLREDNADLRLRETGRRLGLVNDEAWAKFEAKRDAVEATKLLLEKNDVKPSREWEERLEGLGMPKPQGHMSLAEYLRRPDVKIEDLKKVLPELENTDRAVLEQVEIQTKYSGYLEKQANSVKRARKLEHHEIPDDLDYGDVPGLSNEVREKLIRIKPRSLGQAARISGVTPSAVNVLMVWLKKRSA